jgi:hypothetical protein
LLRNFVSPIWALSPLAPQALARTEPVRTIPDKRINKKGHLKGGLFY